MLIIKERDAIELPHAPSNVLLSSITHIQGVEQRERDTNGLQVQREIRHETRHVTRHSIMHAVIPSL